MTTERHYADYTDDMLERAHRDYCDKMAMHGGYRALAWELAAAHKECDAPSNAEEMAAHHDSMATYYHKCALECAAERKLRDAEADAAAEQHQHNTANRC